MNLIVKSFVGLSLLTLIACNSDDDSNTTPPSDFQGEVDWVKTYGGSDLDEAVAIEVANDGNYVILGTTKSTDGIVSDKTTNDQDFLVLKISPEGTLIWSKTFGGTNDEKAFKMVATNDGGFVLTGSSRSNDGDVSGNEGFHDYWILKINAQGEKQWDTNFGFSGSDQAQSIIQTTDGGYFVTGFFDVTASGGEGNDNRNSTLHGVGEYWGIKLDANGNKIWRRYFGGSNNDRSYDVVETKDQGFLMIGSSESDDFDIIDDKGSYDFWVVKVSASGDLMWTKSFGGSEIDVAYTISETNDDNYIIGGDTRSVDKDVTQPLGNADAWLVKMSPTGEKIWQKTYGGSQFESVRGSYLLQNGSILLTGTTRSNDGDVNNNKGQNDAWIYIVDPNGNLTFQKTIGGSSLDFGNHAIETPTNKILIAGNTESNDIDIPQNLGSKDFLIIKLK